MNELQKSERMEIRSKKILVYRLGSLGDTVIALPGFHKIREAFPDAEITLLTNKPVASKAAPLEAVLGKGFFYDRILSYPVGTRNPLTLLNLARKIRSYGCDTVVNITALRSPEADRRDKLFFKMAGVKNFIGFDNAPSDFIPATDSKTGFIEWEAKRLLRKIKSLGEVDLSDNKYWDLKLTPEEVQQGSDSLQNLSDTRKTIMLNAGTKMPVKDWGEENWEQLMEKLSENLAQWNLVVIGVAEEYDLAEKLRTRWNGPSLNLCGKTSPRVSAQVLKSASLFIGHDSGPLHLAACVGTPVVGIYSGLNKPRQWFPRGEANTIIFPRAKCSHCQHFPCIALNGVCILSISVEEVAQSVQKMLQDLHLI